MSFLRLFDVVVNNLVLTCRGMYTLLVLASHSRWKIRRSGEQKLTDIIQKRNFT